MKETGRSIFVSLVAAAATLLCVKGCDSRSGSTAVPAQVSPATFDVTVVWEPSRAALREAALLHDRAGDIDAFSVMTTNPRGIRGYACEIHLVALPDLSASTQELLGHEFAHCLYGSYHQ